MGGDEGGEHSLGHAPSGKWRLRAASALAVDRMLDSFTAAPPADVGVNNIERGGSREQGDARLVTRSGKRTSFEEGTKEGDSASYSTGGESAESHGGYTAVTRRLHDCYTLLRAATCCYTLLRAARCCYTLLHAATRC